MMDLSRFALYDWMHLPRPDDIEDEQLANPQLMLAFRSELSPATGFGPLAEPQRAGPVLDYVHLAANDQPAQAAGASPESTAVTDGRD